MTRPDDVMEKMVEAGADPWAHIPEQYHGRWSYSYSDERKVFFVHCGGYGILESEDSEVCDAVCSAYNNRALLTAALAHCPAQGGAVGELCTYGPVAERRREWIILFDDADKGPAIFDNEPEAVTFWKRATDNWTCTLFATVTLTAAPSPPMPGEG